MKQYGDAWLQQGRQRPDLKTTRPNDENEEHTMASEEWSVFLGSGHCGWMVGCFVWRLLTLFSLDNNSHCLRDERLVIILGEHDLQRKTSGVLLCLAGMK